MEFYKETIMGQVLTQVHDEKNNDPYFDKIDDLLHEIENYEYLETNTKKWQKNGLCITDSDISKITKEQNWIYVETADVAEYSWLVEKLIKIYKPHILDIYRLVSTIGFLLNLYGDKHENLSDILRLTAVTSTVFLHPDHMGLDKFKIHPNNLPPFGKEF